MMSYAVVIVFSTILRGSLAKDAYSYLYSSSWDEISSANGTVKGSLPSWLKGKYIHNGCGAFESFNGKRELNHLFDCFSKLHMWTFDEGEDVKVSAKFQDTNFHKATISGGDLMPYMFLQAESPRFNATKRMQEMKYAMSDDINVAWDNANVNIWDYHVPGAFACTSDVSTSRSIEVDTAMSSGAALPELPLGKFTAAHPQYIPGTRTTINYIYEALPTHLSDAATSTISVFTVLPGENEINTILKVELPHAPYMHSFAVTPHYLVLYLNPTDIDVQCQENFAQGDFFGMASCFAARSEESDTSAIVVIRIAIDDTNNVGGAVGDVVSIALVPSQMVFHTINAFENDNGDVVLTAIGFPDISVLTSLSFSVKDMKNKETRDAFKENGYIAPALFEHTIQVGPEPTVGALLSDESSPFVSVAKQVLALQASALKSGSQNVYSTTRQLHTNLYTPSTREGGVEKEDGEDDTFTITSPYPFEYPQINPHFAGYEACYVYGVAPSFAGGSSEYSSNAIVKKNLCDEFASVQVLDLSPDQQWVSGDCSFAATKTASSQSSLLEDDGVIFVPYFDGQSIQSYLRIVDAKSLRTIATITTPMNKFIMPYSFHGNWVESSDDLPSETLSV